MSEAKGALATALGTFYPKHFVVAVVHEQPRAEEAIAALRQAGFGDEIVGLHTAEEVRGNHQAFMEHRRLGQRLTALFPSEETDALNEYLAEATAGANFVTVHAPAAEQQETAHDILKEHGGHAIRYYGDATITDL